MFYYTYDGTFNGLLTIIYEIYYRRQIPEQIVPAQNTDFQLLYGKNTFQPMMTKLLKYTKLLRTRSVSAP